MTTSYRVFLHDLSMKIEELNVLAEQLRREILILEAIEDRLNGMWEGESRAIFHEAFVRDIYRMHHFHLAIYNYAERLQRIYIHYTTAELATSELARTRLL